MVIKKAMKFGSMLLELFALVIKIYDHFDLPKKTVQAPRNLPEDKYIKITYKKEKSLHSNQKSGIILSRIGKFYFR